MSLTSKTKSSATSPTKGTFRRQRIAAGIVAGKSLTSIAGEENISRGWASKHAHSPEVQQIVASLMNSELASIHQLFIRALNVIAESFVAERSVVVDGKPVSVGPDHYARLTGAKRFLEFASAGRAAPKASDVKPNPPVTLAEVRELLGVQKGGRPLKIAPDAPPAAYPRPIKNAPGEGSD